MGIQFLPIAFLYLLYFYIIIVFFCMMMIVIISWSIFLYRGKKHH